jgi:hypothetical protein
MHRFDEINKCVKSIRRCNGRTCLRFIFVRPKVATNWASLVLRMREILGSHLDLEMGISSLRDSLFPSFSPGKYRESTSNLETTVSFHTLSNSLFTNHLITGRYIYWTIVSSVKWAINKEIKEAVCIILYARSNILHFGKKGCQVHQITVTKGSFLNPCGRNVRITVWLLKWIYSYEIHN